MTRKGPQESATDYQVGTKRRGVDKKMWICVINSAGIQRWKHLSDEKYKIRVCEPITLVDSKRFSVDFTCGKEFLETLQKMPKIYVNRKESGYIFGHKFPLSTYTHVGRHENDVAMTGVVNITDITKEEEKKIKGISVDSLLRISDKTMWHDKRKIQLIQKTSRNVLFIGETIGGDVGADVYTHATNGKVDGLIIDNRFFFEDDDE